MSFKTTKCSLIVNLIPYDLHELRVRKRIKAARIRWSTSEQAEQATRANFEQENPRIPTTYNQVSDVKSLIPVFYNCLSVILTFRFLLL